MVKKFRTCFACILVAALVLSFVSSSVFAEETSQDLSAILTKEVVLGNDLKFDMFLSSSVSFVTPENVKAGETATWEFGLTPASIMMFLEIPSINRTYVTETEVSLQDSQPITIFDGVSIILDLSPSVDLSVAGPATLNQSHLTWDNFSNNQTFETPVFLNASNKDELTINAAFYLDAQISVYIQLQNYTSEIANYPIPQLKMLPKISRSVEVSAAPTIMDSTETPTFLIIGVIVIASAVVIAVILVKSLRSRTAKKDFQVQTLGQTPEQPKQSRNSESTIYCIHCGEKLPAEATYCRKCGKKLD